VIAMNVRKPDGSTIAKTIQTAARAAQVQTTHGSGFPMNRSRRLRRFISVMGATLLVELRVTDGVWGGRGATLGSFADEDGV